MSDASRMTPPDLKADMAQVPVRIPIRLRHKTLEMSRIMREETLRCEVRRFLNIAEGPELADAFSKAHGIRNRLVVELVCAVAMAAPQQAVML